MRRADASRRAVMARSRSVALAVARYLVVFLKRPGGQAQFSAALALQVADDRFGALHDWIGSHLAGDLSLSALADRAGMSERSFSRRYAEATGLTPARAIERLRVEAARRLLSDTRQPLKRIALRCGFGSEEPCGGASCASWSRRRRTIAPGLAPERASCLYWGRNSTVGRVFDLRLTDMLDHVNGRNARK
jgi:AraC-like DNA-binding protein